MVNRTGEVRSSRNSTSDRTLQILGMFSDSRLRVTPAQISSELEMSRSTTYRYIQSLVREQFLESASDGSLRLGMRVLHLARLARDGLGVSELARPVMSELAHAHKQTILLTVLSGGSALCLEREEDPDQFVRLSYEPGAELPLNAGASALVLLAWRPRDEARRLLARSMRRFTENTVTDIDTLLERLSDIKDAGECVSYAEVDRDALGIAVPIFESGDVVASLSMVALQSRFSTSRVAHALVDMRRGAERISQRLTAVRAAGQ